MKKTVLSIVCFLAISQFSMAQSKAEQMINNFFDEYGKNPTAVFQKYTTDEFIFINSEGDFWDKNKSIKKVAGAKLDEYKISNKKIRTVGEISVVTGINESKWSIGDFHISYKDAFTYTYQAKGNDIKWLSGQHSLLTPKDRNKAIYLEMVKLKKEGKLTDFGKYYAESFESKGFGKGPEAALAHANSYLKAFPDLQIEVIEIIAEGDLVMARIEATGTQKGEIMGMPASGKSIKSPHWTINRFDADGKIVESWNLNDDLSNMKQLGFIK